MSLFVHIHRATTRFIDSLVAVKLKDVDFEENEHPRDMDGKFRAGAGTHIKTDNKSVSKESKLLHFDKDKPIHAKELNGVPFTSYDQPDEWDYVSGQNKQLTEPPMPQVENPPYKNKKGELVPNKHKYKRTATGVIMVEPDGRVWLVKPSHKYGGYKYTFAKGGLEEDINPQANAIKEAWEESGLKAQVNSHLGDYEGDTTVTRFYLGERKGGTPVDHGWESEEVVLVPLDEAHKYLNRSRDKEILADVIKSLKTGDAAVFKEEEHPRGKGGKFAKKGEAFFGAVDPSGKSVSSYHLVKALNEKGYKKQKKLSPGGYIVYQHPDTGHKVYIGQATPKQKIVLHAFRHKEDIGVGPEMLKEKLEELHGEGKKGEVSNELLEQLGYGEKKTEHPDPAIHSQLTDWGFTPTDQTSEASIYTNKAGYEVFFNKTNKLWFMNDPQGEEVEAGTGLNQLSWLPVVSPEPEPEPDVTQGLPPQRYPGGKIAKDLGFWLHGSYTWSKEYKNQYGYTLSIETDQNIDGSYTWDVTSPTGYSVYGNDLNDLNNKIAKGEIDIGGVDAEPIPIPSKPWHPEAFVHDVAHDLGFEPFKEHGSSIQFENTAGYAIYISKNPTNAGEYHWGVNDPKGNNLATGTGLTNLQDKILGGHIDVGAKVVAAEVTPAPAATGIEHPKKFVHDLTKKMGFTAVSDYGDQVQFKNAAGYVLDISKDDQGGSYDWNLSDPNYNAMESGSGLLKLSNQIKNGSIDVGQKVSKLAAKTAKVKFPKQLENDYSKEEYTIDPNSVTPISKIFGQGAKITKYWTGTSVNNPTESIQIGEDGKWRIWTSNQGTVATGQGQESFNEEFEKLHPRDEHGHFIHKAGQATTTTTPKSYTYVHMSNAVTKEVLASGFTPSQENAYEVQYKNAAGWTLMVDKDKAPGGGTYNWLLYDDKDNAVDVGGDAENLPGHIKLPPIDVQAIAAGTQTQQIHNNQSVSTEVKSAGFEPLKEDTFTYHYKSSSGWVLKVEKGTNNDGNYSWDLYDNNGAFKDGGNDASKLPDKYKQVKATTYTPKHGEQIEVGVAMAAVGFKPVKEMTTHTKFMNEDGDSVYVAFMKEGGDYNYNGGISGIMPGNGLANLIAQIQSKGLAKPPINPSEAWGTPPKTQTTPPPPPVTTPSSKQLEFSQLTKIGEKKGSNPGGTYEDKDGSKYYLKQVKSNNHAKNEVLAGVLYGLVGNTFQYHLVNDAPNLYVATSWQTLQKDNIDDLNDAERKEAQSDFAIQAWLANWDAAGIDNTNIGVDANGKTVPTDLGGALLYRAQGEPKYTKWNDNVDEWESLRDPKRKNTYALYGQMTQQELTQSAEKLKSITDNQIKSAVSMWGPGTVAEKTELINTLIKRRDRIFQKAKVPYTPSPITQQQAPPTPTGPTPYKPPDYQGSSELRNKLNKSAVPQRTSSESNAIGIYKQSGYISMNNCLRLYDPEDCLQDDSRIGVIDKYLEKCVLDVKGTTGEDFVILYRGIKEHTGNKIVNIMKTGRRIKEHGFMSASTSIDTARSFAGHNGPVFQIKVPHGAIGCTIETGYSDGENEILFQRGTYMKISKMGKNQYGCYEVEYLPPKKET